jgi:hypothetical protein
MGLSLKPHATKLVLGLLSTTQLNCEGSSVVLGKAIRGGFNTIRSSRRGHHCQEGRDKGLSFGEDDEQGIMDGLMAPKNAEKRV